MRGSRGVLLLLAVSAIAAGCSGVNSASGGLQQLPATGGLESLERQALQTTTGSAIGHLYVVRPYTQSLATPPATPIPGRVSVFALNSTQQVWSVPDRDGSSFQFSIAFDRAGNVYEAHEEVNDVAVFPPHGTTPSREIRIGLLHPFSVWFDAIGNLYVTNYPILARPSATPSGPPPTLPPTPPTASQTSATPTPLPPGWISVYAPDGSRPIRTITSPKGYVPYALAFDSVANLYVANGPADDNPNRNAGVVEIYAPNAVRPVRTIWNGVHSPEAIAVDPRRRTVYVGNSTGNVSVYEAGSNVPSYTLRAVNPASLALDRLGDVYIADFSQPGGVAEYAPGRMNALRSLAAGDLGVISVALDPDGNLYAADQFDNRVFVYAPGKTQPFRVYTTLNPAFVTISP